MSHYIKHPEAIWTTIKKPFTDPVDWLHDVGETVYDTAIAPTKLIADTVGNFSPKGKEFLRAPTYDELGKPGQAFADRIDAKNAILPADWRPYAQPIESALMNFIPGVGPWASAAFNTAYEGGKQQQQNKGFDWGDFGKNAAINFGTAAITQGASKLLSNADKVNAFKTGSAGMHVGTEAANPAGAGKGVFSSFSNLDDAANVGKAAQLANSTTNSANALSAIGAIPSTVSAAEGPMTAGNTLNSFGAGLNEGAAPNLGSSTSSISDAARLQSSGTGFADTAYKAAVNSGKVLGTQVLADTLAPQGNQAISGAMDGFGGDGSHQYQPQWGDVLNAFGGQELNTPNSSGYRIDDKALNSMIDRLSANSYLQQNQARDSAFPAGQYQADLNTPYANRLNEINSGTTQSYNDLIDQVNNANRYYSIIDSNPGLTSEQLDTFLQNPNGGALGDFYVGPDQQDFFKGINPLGPNNTSLTSGGNFTVTPVKNGATPTPFIL